MKRLTPKTWMALTTALTLTALAGCPLPPEPAAGDDDTAGDDDDTAPDPDPDGDGFTADEGDCAPDDPAVHPGAEELACDGVDNDCDGAEPLALRVPLDLPTIQAGIDAAPAGSTVCVDPGVYFENLTLEDKDISLVGVAGPELTWVDGGLVGRVLTVEGVSAAAQIRGLTLTRGSFGSGGALFVYEASPTLRELVIRDSEAAFCAGALFVLSSSEVSHTEVDANTAMGMGGGLCGDHADLTLDHLHVHNNLSGDSGGGILLRESTAEIAHTLVEGNVALLHGGGIEVHDGSHLDLRDSRLVCNESSIYGGGARLEASTFDLDNVEVVHNTTGDFGGGLAIQGSMGTVHNARILGNHAGNGGGLELWASDTEIHHTSIVGNTADMEGGGLIDEFALRTTLAGSIVAHNDALVGDGLAAVGSAPTLLYNGWWDNGLSHVSGLPDPVGSSGNVEGDPGFLSLTGEPAEWDLHLGADSPLIDAADPNTSDPDGSPADPGAYGGAGAASYDLDGDGHDEWWHPGPYTSADAADGWDCDDSDPAAHPLSGC